MTQPSPGCQPSPAWSQAAAWGTRAPAGISAARCWCWCGLCVVSLPLAFSAEEKKEKKKGILIKLNIAFNWIICTNTNPVMRLFWKKYLPCEQGSGVPCLLVQKQREPLLWSQGLYSGWRAGWIWAAFSSPLPLPCIYTPKSPYECVSLRLDGVSHSPRANGSAGKGFEESRAATCSMKCL